MKKKTNEVNVALTNDQIDSLLDLLEYQEGDEYLISCKDAEELINKLTLAKEQVNNV